MSGPRVRRLSPLDQLVCRADALVRAASRTGLENRRDYPAEGIAEGTLEAPQRAHAAGLMRVNHSGEVCAQALYVGQALVARKPDVYQQLNDAASEEVDHLLWCERRLEELDSAPSRLNRLWFAGAFGIGVTAAALGDRWSMAFVEETENQVVRHLDDHLESLPAGDHASRAVVSAMRDDEARHASLAGRDAAQLPTWIRRLMAFQARVMTTLAYRI